MCNQTSLDMSEFTEMDDAISVFKSREQRVCQEDIRSSWQVVLRSIYSKRVCRYAIWIGAAAVLCCAVVFSAIKAYAPIAEKAGIMDFVAETDAYVSAKGDIMLMVPGQPNVKVASSSVNVVQSEDGAHVIDYENEVQVVVDAKEGDSEIEYNQLLVPNGKRSFLTLADGSRIWVNSGSRIVYPSSFRETREIYLAGEAYMEIARNELSPFIVHTNDCSIKVLGTVFNVSSYPSHKSSSVVLVEGSVNVVADDEQEVVLSPGEHVTVRGGIISEKEDVDVDSYISWIHNILVCRNDSLTKVFDKLQVCYGKNIILGPGLSFITVTGKLYLKEDFHDVLKSISYSVPLTYEDSGDTMYIYKRMDEEQGMDFTSVSEK